LFVVVRIHRFCSQIEIASCNIIEIQNNFALQITRALKIALKIAHGTLKTQTEEQSLGFIVLLEFQTVRNVVAEAKRVRHVVAEAKRLRHVVAESI
jgi:hypothetical protein